MSTELRRQVTVLLYNAFVAVWIAAFVLNRYLLQGMDPESSEYGRKLDGRLESTPVICGLFAFTLLALLLRVWRDIPRWFRLTLSGLLLLYIGSSVHLIAALSEYVAGGRVHSF